MFTKSITNLRTLSIAIVMAAVLMAGMNVSVQPAQAQTSTDAELQAVINQLLQQIVLLQDRLNELRAGAGSEGGFDKSIVEGDRVQSTDTLKVRTAPSTGAGLINVVPAFTNGTVRQGPDTADGYVWWYVSYDNGVSGWSAENWLRATGITAAGGGGGSSRSTSTPSTPVADPSAALEVTGVSSDVNGTTAEFEIVFEITASDQDLYLPNSPSYAGRPFADEDFVNFSILKNGVVMDGYDLDAEYDISLYTTAENTRSFAGYSNGEAAYAQVYVVEEAQTERFTLQVEFTPVESGNYALHLENPLRVSPDKTFTDGNDFDVAFSEVTTNAVWVAMASTTAELQIAASAENPDSSMFELEEGDESDFYTVFAFELEAEDTDQKMYEIEFDFDISPRDTNFDNFVDDMELVVDGITYTDYDVDGDVVSFDFGRGAYLDEDDEVEAELILSFESAEEAAGITFDVSIESIEVETDRGDAVTVLGSEYSEEHKLVREGADSTTETNQDLRDLIDDLLQQVESLNNVPDEDERDDMSTAELQTLIGDLMKQIADQQPEEPGEEMSDVAPEYNRYACDHSLRSNLDGGYLACYGMWDYGQSFGGDKNMCGSYGGGTGCEITAPMCASGKATATEYHGNRDLKNLPTSSLALIAQNLGVTSDLVTEEVAGLWEYHCTAAEVEEPTVPQDPKNVQLTDGNDRFIYEDSLDHFVYAKDGDDFVRTGSGDDRVSGQDGSDVIETGAGDDYLFPGQGNDILTGGSGRDYFWFSEYEFPEGQFTSDTITDFESGVDRVYLSSFERGNYQLDDFEFVQISGGLAIKIHDTAYILLDGYQDKSELESGDVQGTFKG